MGLIVPHVGIFDSINLECIIKEPALEEWTARIFSPRSNKTSKHRLHTFHPRKAAGQLRKYDIPQTTDAPRNLPSQPLCHLNQRTSKDRLRSTPQFISIAAWSVQKNSINVIRQSFISPHKHIHTQFIGHPVFFFFFFSNLRFSSSSLHPNLGVAYFWKGGEGALQLLPSQTKEKKKKSHHPKFVISSSSARPCGSDV